MVDNKGPTCKASTARDLESKGVVEDNDPAQENFILTAKDPQLDSTTSTLPADPHLIEAPLILLAEDNEFTAETMRDYLLFHGFQVRLARDGYEVIEQALAFPPDLIIMDIQMPGLNGFEATQHLRTKALTAKTPIIALTALAMSGDRERCLNAGANAYFSKPLSLRLLIDTIRQFLSKAY